jgi:hypothetical protein
VPKKVSALLRTEPFNEATDPPAWNGVLGRFAQMRFEFAKQRINPDRLAHRQSVGKSYRFK